MDAVDVVVGNGRGGGWYVEEYYRHIAIERGWCSSFLELT